MGNKSTDDKCAEKTQRYFPQLKAKYEWMHQQRNHLIKSKQQSTTTNHHDHVSPSSIAFFQCMEFYWKMITQIANVNKNVRMRVNHFHSTNSWDHQIFQFLHLSSFSFSFPFLRSTPKTELPACSWGRAHLELGCSLQCWMLGVGMAAPVHTDCNHIRTTFTRKTTHCKWKLFIYIGCQNIREMHGWWLGAMVKLLSWIPVQTRSN